MYQTTGPIADAVKPGSTRWFPRESRLVIGAARNDITPPIGIRAHNWGAAPTGQASGVHRPLVAGALAISTVDGEWKYLVTADLGWWQSMEIYSSVFDPIARAVGADDAALLLHLVHTHAGPTLAEGDSSLPGSELVEPYRARLVDTIIELIREARANAALSTITWDYGRCEMAVVRDQPSGPRYVVGFDPKQKADDTVVVGRVTRADGALAAVLMNYACHPTTLTYENSLLSPDYIGAARSVVEDATGVPCFFFQGASGELAPREQHAPGTELADRHGRSLGHAVLATLNNMGEPATCLEFKGVVESGAPLGVWHEEPSEPPSDLAFDMVNVRLECRPPVDAEALTEQWSGIDPVAARERIARAERLADGYNDNGEAQHPVWVWQLGDAVIVAHPGEAYSLMQTELRRRNPGRVVMVLNLTNGPGFMYLPPKDAYGQDLYPVWQTLLAAGSLERVIEAADAEIKRLSPAREVVS